ncbi:hypothetical protein EJ070_19765 [Mesorhizobium sp. M1E.F.Ca.ET.045.02.1.1]|uniref:hypothetical protein n=1 Tax=Mesorhizobium sp. M1E.F.Ca.ET.045.02.1.1 TaxID=2493672 RepID=UPI000F74F7C6|nr:hypothetical protein [Mesorhizobium sp. M1E.F.Ca.ET.045.02.1.1]AZO22679.1 hypothetical protein EJ070_19765 [Mesorhizobium sp. M1E.F.Ca.ET.045.02.1.1]
MKLRLTIAFTLGFLIGGFVVLAVISSTWLTQALAYNFSWDRGREWFGALSRWAAAAGALVAAWLTVPHLKRQADFIWGDAPPTLDVIEHLAEDNTLVVRLVNWNRRAIFLEDIYASTKKRPKNLDEQVAIWQIADENGARDGGFPVQIDGWEDRDKRPSFVRVDLILLKQIPGTEDGWTTDGRIPFPSDATITAKVRMLGNVHRNFELQADAFPRN